MMINDYNNTGIIGSNCAFWNGLHRGQVVGRETAASAWESWKHEHNWLKAALLIALARAWEKALVWLYGMGSLEALWFWVRSVPQNTSRKENRCSATWQRFNKALRKITMFALPFLTSGSEAGGRLFQAARVLSWNRKGTLLEFSFYLWFCCSPSTSLQRVFGDGKRKGDNRRKRLDY